MHEKHFFLYFQLIKFILISSKSIFFHADCRVKGSEIKVQKLELKIPASVLQCLEHHKKPLCFKFIMDLI